MEKQSDTFSEGIAPGGLREKSEIKLLLCYLLKMVDRSLSRSQINDILQEYPIANYFEVNEALNELVKNGTVISELGEKDELFSVTHKTKYEVSSIERSLPRSIREKAVSAALAESLILEFKFHHPQKNNRKALTSRLFSVYIVLIFRRRL